LCVNLRLKYVEVILYIQYKIKIGVCKTCLCSIRSGNNNVTSTPASIGSGLGFREPIGIKVEADGSSVVFDLDRDAVVRVDLVSGNRTIVSDASTGQWIIANFIKKKKALPKKYSKVTLYL